MSKISTDDWMIQIPLSELVVLQALPVEVDKIKAENQQMRHEIDGLRRIQSEILQAFGDLRRSLQNL